MREFQGQGENEARICAPTLYTALLCWRSTRAWTAGARWEGQRGGWHTHAGAHHARSRTCSTVEPLQALCGLKLEGNWMTPMLRGGER